MGVYFTVITHSAPGRRDSWQFSGSLLGFFAVVLGSIANSTSLSEITTLILATTFPLFFRVTNLGVVVAISCFPKLSVSGEKLSGNAPSCAGLVVGFGVG